MSEVQGSVLAGNPAPAAAAGDPAAPPPAAAPQGAPPAAGGSGEWFDGFPDDVRGVIQNKGWKSPADAIGSYMNLEKLLGADKAGRGLVMPKDDAPAEEWSAFWGRLGRPETPDGYQLPVPEGDPGEFAKTAATWFHDVGIPAKQAQALTEKWNEYQQAVGQQMEAEWQQRSALDVQELQKSWGQQFDAQVELGRRAIREAGLSAEQAVAIERALGVKAAAEAFAKLGRAYAEAPMKGGDGAGPGSFGATPEDAKARIAALKGDAAWAARYLNGDADARAEFERLHQIAFG